MDNPRTLIAHALYQGHAGDPWREIGPARSQGDCEAGADAVLEALREAGFAVTQLPEGFFMRIEGGTDG